ncbi:MULTISPECIES: transposase [Lachnospiraceae]|uniref:transposase n=1 Tax=Coprococcus TaxID=33042 RepID=UPI001FADC0C5|nr:MULTISPECIES: transposase [Coprococcus]
MRWGIETSFRELKYAIGLTSFHARKPDFIKQGIYARLLLYNYCELITTHVIKQMKNNDKTKQVNFTIAIYICREGRMKKLSFFHTPFLIFFDSLFLSQNNKPPLGEQTNFFRIFSFFLAL